MRREFKDMSSGISSILDKVELGIVLPINCMDFDFRGLVVLNL